VECAALVHFPPTKKLVIPSLPAQAGEAEDLLFSLVPHLRVQFNASVFAEEASFAGVA